MIRYDAASRALGLCALAAAMIWGGVAQAATINVPTDQPTIAAALTVAGGNDIILEAGYAATTEVLSITETGETIAGNSKTIASVSVSATGGAIINNLTIANANAAVGSHVIVNGGTLAINNGAIIATNAAGAATSSVINILGNGTLSLTNTPLTSTMINGEAISVYNGNLTMTNSNVTANTGAGMFAIGIALTTGGNFNINIDGCTFTTTRNCMRTNATNPSVGTLTFTNSRLNAVAPAGTALVINGGTTNTTINATNSSFYGGTNIAINLNGGANLNLTNSTVVATANNVGALYVNAAYQGALTVTNSTLRSGPGATGNTGLFWAGVPNKSTLSIDGALIDVSGAGILIGGTWPLNSPTSIANTNVYSDTGSPFTYDAEAGAGALTITNCDLMTSATAFGILHRGDNALSITDSLVQTGGQALWSDSSAITALRTTLNAGVGSATPQDAVFNGSTGTCTYTECTITNQASGLGLFRNAGNLTLHNTDIANKGNTGLYYATSGALSLNGSSITTTDGTALWTDASPTLLNSDFVTSCTGSNHFSVVTLNVGANDAALNGCSVTLLGAGPDAANSWFRPAIVTMLTGALTLNNCIINSDLSAYTCEGFVNPTGPQPSRLIIDNSTINAKGIGVMMGRNGGTSWTMENTVINATTGNYSPATDAAVYAGNCQFFAKDCTIRGINAAGGPNHTMTLDNTDVIGGTYALVGYAGSDIRLLNGCTVSTASASLYIAAQDNTTFTAANSTLNMGYNGQNIAWQSAITKMATSCAVELNECVINGSGGTALALNPGGYPYMAGLAGPAWAISGTTIGNVASVFRSNADNQLDFFDCHLDQSVLSGVRDGTTLNVTSTTMQSAGTMFLIEQPGHEAIPYVNTFNVTSSTLSTYPASSPLWHATGSSITLNRILLTASDLRTSNGAILDQADSAIQTTATHCRFTGGSNTILFRGRPLLGVQNGVLVDQCDFYNTDPTTVMWAQPGTTGDFLFRDSILNGNIYNGVPGGAANAGVATIQNCVASVTDPLQVGTAAVGVNKFGVDPKYYSVAYGDAQYLGLWSDSPAWQFNSGLGGPENYCGAVGKVANVPSAVRNWVLY